MGYTLQVEFTGLATRLNTRLEDFKNSFYSVGFSNGEEGGVFTEMGRSG